MTTSQTTAAEVEPRLSKRLIPYLPALLLLAVALAPPLNHDAAAILDLVERWIDGEPLYARLLDPNPPLIFVLNLLPAALGRIPGLNGVVGLQMCILLLGAAVWWLVARMRRRDDEGPIEQRFLDVVPALVVVAAGYEFGQREHLMAIGALPYLFLAARRARGELAPHRYAVAVLAAVVFALKPYFLGVPALVELSVLRSRGWSASLRDPVPWVMAGVWIAYLASWPLAFPAYLKVVLPLVSSTYLGGLSFLQMLLVPRFGASLTLLVPLLWWASRKPEPLTTILAIATIGAAASALIQLKGWFYHILPAVLFGCLLAGVLAARWLDRHRATWRASPDVPAFALSALFALLSLAGTDAPWRELGYRNRQEQTELTALLTKADAGSRVLSLSPRIWPIYPALNYIGAHQTLRALHLWPLQGAYRTCLPAGRRYREIEEMGWAERLMFDSVAEDLAAAPPQVVIVDQLPGIPWCGSQFDFLEYFGRNPLFARTFAGYELFGETSCLTIYVRSARPACVSDCGNDQHRLRLTGACRSSP
jgi:hypothetical protein